MSETVLALAKWKGHGIRVVLRTDSWGAHTAELLIDNESVANASSNWVGAIDALEADVSSRDGVCVVDRCGARNGERASYCGTCGTELVDRQVRVVAHIQAGALKYSCRVEVDGEWITDGE